MTRDSQWPAWIVAAARLRIAPDAFWRLSVREWRALSAPLAASGALDREAFTALAARYPDNQR